MIEPNSTIIEVAIPLHLETTFHYLVPDRLAPLVQIGKRVLAPFGRRKLTGYIIGRVKSAEGELREIIDLLDPEPLFTAKELEFLRWTASYYLHPLGGVLKGALPAGINIESRRRSAPSADGTEITEEVLTGGREVKTAIFYRLAGASEGVAPLKGKRALIVEFLRGAGEAPSSVLRRECRADGTLLKELEEKGYITAEAREIYRDPFREEVFERDRPLCLNSAQEEALSRITAAADAEGFAPFLLHGGDKLPKLGNLPGFFRSRENNPLDSAVHRRPDIRPPRVPVNTDKNLGLALADLPDQLLQVLAGNFFVFGWNGVLKVENGGIRFKVLIPHDLLRFVSRKNHPGTP